MKQFKYRALEMAQRKQGPRMFLTSASASELLQWCDVPRTRGSYMAGYQRALDPKRQASLADYLEKSPGNIIPGAVIIAVDIDSLEFVEENPGVCQISVSEDQRDFEQRLEELFGAFSTRLSSDELESANVWYSEAVELTLDGEEEEEEEEEEDEATPPTSYLAALTEELNAALQDWGSLSSERQQAIRDYIEGVSKPGLIIDGQHRVFGAKDVSSEEIYLPVVLIPGLNHAEQVFQFYVLNSKARPLKPTELRRIVSTSLTNAEIQSLYERFQQAGVDAEASRWTYEMNTRESSPFRGRIDLGLGHAGAVIKENVAHQLVSKFMRMSRKKFGLLTGPLGEHWENTENRLEIFFWLWNGVREQYAEAWAKAEAKADAGHLPQLFMKVAMITLQEFLLNRFVTALPYREVNSPPPFESEVEVRKMVRSTLQNLPGEFFTREWRMKQIDTSQGRKELYAQMERVWTNQGKIHGNQKLFSGN